MSGPEKQHTSPSDDPRTSASSGERVRFSVVDPECKPAFSNLGTALFNGDVGGIVSSVRALLGAPSGPCMVVESDVTKNQSPGLANVKQDCVQAASKLIAANTSGEESQIAQSAKEMDSACGLTSRALAKIRSVIHLEKCEPQFNQLAEGIRSKNQDATGKAAFLIAQEACIQQKYRSANQPGTPEQAEVKPGDVVNDSQECAKAFSNVSALRFTVAHEMEKIARKQDTLDDVWPKLDGALKADLSQAGKDLDSNCDISAQRKPNPK